MPSTNHVPPERMPPAERAREVAQLLALGLARLREAGAAPSAQAPSESALGLGLCAEQRLHDDPVNHTCKGS